jgi:hypothetical protein
MYGTLERAPTRVRFYTGPTVQGNPELFTRKAIMSEIRYLARLDEKYGTGLTCLRVIARQKLYSFMIETDKAGK